MTCLWLIKRTEKLGLVDMPNIRSSHNKPMPKGGGAGIVLGMLAGLAICHFSAMAVMNIKYLVIITGFCLMAIMGFYNDRFNLSALTRIILQTFIACTMVYFAGNPTSFEIGGYGITLGYIGAAFAVIWLVAITNFYNFMDGIDGLAAMQGIIAGIGIVIFGIILKEGSLIPMGLVLLGAAVGFLILNSPPAKIFMGDVGSYSIGFYIASLGLINRRLLVPIAMVLGVFIFDTVVTLIRRVCRGERWYQAHRSHFYQRAVQLGYSHLQVTSAISVLFVLLTAMACIYLLAAPLTRVIILIAALLVLTGSALWVIVKEKSTRRKENVDKS